MAELASGAVSSLLGVIRNEQQLLSGVRGDVQFIKEEMESMNSFLLHLARMAPPGGEHDEQVRTWMNQVRLLAHDCNNCLDLYLYRGNPDIHLPKGGPQRYLLWARWFLHKMIAQHRAAVKLRVLKERARDVGERRLRYSVEVPAKAVAAAGLATPLPLLLPSSSAGAPVAAAGGEAAANEDVDDDPQATDHSGPRGALLGLRVLDLEDYFEGMLADWIKQVPQRNTATKAESTGPPSIAIVAPDNAKDADALARQALAAAKTHFWRSVLVDIPAVHPSYVRLRPEDILCYIWRYLERAEPQSQQQHIHWRQRTWRWGIYYERKEAIRQIKKKIRETMKLYDKFESIKKMIGKVKSDQVQLDLKNTEEDVIRKKISDEQDLGVLLLQLRSAAAAADEQDQVKKKAKPTLAGFYDDIIKTTSRNLKKYMEVKNEEDEEEYAKILREVFPKTSNSQKPLQAEEKDTKNRGALCEDRIKEMIKEMIHNAKEEILIKEMIKEMIHNAKEEILQEVQKKLENLENKEATGKPGSKDRIPETVTTGSTKKIQEIQGQTSEAANKENQGQIPADEIAETTGKIDIIEQKIEKLMEIKGIVEEIQRHLKKERTLVILRIDQTGWEETRNTFSLLGCVAGAVIVTTSKNTQQAKEYCNPPREPMLYSLVGLYHDIVLQLTSTQMNEEDNKPNPQTFRDILEECEPHEFCMRIFAHALCAKPKRSNEELCKLHTNLKAVSPKSFGSIAKKMLKFSYNDLPKEYKSCLLYLAIFPPRDTIRRSTLIGRWVVEGLITTDDWRWSSSVRRANQCFNELIDRWLVYPTDIGATGEVKSCMVGDRVHEFIIKIAEKQHIVETRLSNHLARHFSISNDIRLRASDKIEDLFLRLSKQSQFLLLKVLDLEGCHCFGVTNKHNLKVICCKIKLLKYLSVRRTNIIELPSEINNIHELEVLDIRQTEVPPSATRNLRLLKLKRLLAGHTDPSPSSTDTGTASSSLEIPEKVENMEDMEVLSRVKPRNKQDLKDIGSLWQLRKLGVVIEERKSHLTNLLEAISNLHECIRSLSITLLPPARRKGTPSSEGSSDDISRLHTPKVLESLSIISGSGTTQKVPVQLLQLLLANDNNNQLTKVTLSNTLLSEEDLKVLSKLPMLRCLRLRQTEYKNKLTFKKGDFQKLKYFLVEGSKINDISFEKEATVELETIVLPLDNSLKLSGVNNLLRLEELELNNNNNKSNNITAVAATESKTTPVTGIITTPSANNSNNTKSNNNSNTNNTTPSVATVTTTTTTLATVAPNTNTTPTTVAPNINTTPATATTMTTNTTPAAATIIPSTTTTPTSTTPIAATTTTNTTPSATATTPFVTAATSNTTLAVIVPNTNTTPTTSATMTTNTTPAAAATNTTPASITPVAATTTTNTTPSVAATSNTTPAIVAPNTNTTPAATNTSPANTTPVTAATATNNTPSTAATTTDNTPSAAAATTTNTMLLSLLENAKRIAKVTLRGTMLKQGDLQFLAKMPNIRCLVLLEKSYDESQLTFNKDDFPKLKLLIVKCSNITKLSFTTRSSPKLEKFTWTFTNMESLSGIGYLPRLKEFEFKGEFVPNEVKEDIKKHKKILYFTSYKPENKGQGERSTVQKSGVAKFPWLSKGKGWHQRRN